MKPIVIHPFLFALSPILTLYSHNVGLVLISEIYLSAAIVLASTVALLLLLQFLVRDNARAGIIVSGFLVLFFSYGHVVHATRTWEMATWTALKSYLLPTLWTGCFVLYAYFFMNTRRPLHRISPILNIASAALVAIPLMNIASYKFKTSGHSKNGETRLNTEIKTTNSKKTEDLPDIYYIILDRYADFGTLKDIYGFDNTEFTSYLSRKGFYIATKSKANYLKTAHSVASSLNLEYINYLSDRAGENSNDWSYLYSLLQEHQVWRFLKLQGYKFIHFGSWWEPTRTNTHADININPDPLPQFLYVLYRTTLLYPIGSRLGLLDFRRANWKRVHYQLEKLGEIPNIEAPTFAFAHLLITHEPYAFNSDGTFLTIADYLARSREDNYIRQVRFANKKIQDLVDQLLSRPGTPPIIIIQSDEGPLPRRFEADEFNFNWTQATTDELNEKMGILNAYYLPGVDTKRLYDSISPVNSFRLIFNLYFDTDLDLLPDKSYAFVDQSHPYKFFDITERIDDN